MFLRAGVLYQRHPRAKAPRHLSGRLRTAYQRADLALVRAMTKLPPSPASAGFPGRG